MAKMAQLAAEEQELAMIDAYYDTLEISIDSDAEMLMQARGELDAAIERMHDAGATVEQMAEAFAGGMADALRQPVEVQVVPGLPQS